MTNKAVLAKLNLAIQLMELHSENTFKIRNYKDAADKLEIHDAELDGQSLEELQATFGKSIGAKIQDLLLNDSFDDLDELMSKTPNGVIELLDVKGLGPKRVWSLWQEHGLMSKEAVLQAIDAGELAKLKGFGQKTAENIKRALAFTESVGQHWLYADAEPVAHAILTELQALFPRVGLTGDLLMLRDTVASFDYVVEAEDANATLSALNAVEQLAINEVGSGPYTIRGVVRGYEMPFTIYLVKKGQFDALQLQTSAGGKHLGYVGAHTSLYQQLMIKHEAKIIELYSAAGLPYIIPEMRESADAFEWASKFQESDIITYADIKGTVHNHSTWSDGGHTLDAMAQEAKRLGLTYFGIADHSQTAVYANGLNAFRLAEQWKEIDALNQQDKSFKILKGIESDILNDGSLDYPDEVLSGFDYVVASIHSNLNMDTVKATDRLLKAVENPYTTILGHPSGRLLLKREGYPYDRKSVIDACIQYGVVIELNASPWRLDLEWQWLHYAIMNGAMISINPDAHDKKSLPDMRYGVLVARKAGVPKARVLNAFNAEQIATYLAERKAKQSIPRGY